jgi:hypothetical protein
VPFPFDCLVSNEEKALLSDGKHGSLLGWQTLSEDGKLRALLLTHAISPVEREYRWSVTVEDGSTDIPK